MKVNYDASVDAFQLRLAPGTPVAKTIEWGPGIHVDVDADGRLLGVEVLDASMHFDKSSLAALRPPSNALSLAQAAKDSGLSSGTLRVLLNSGRLKGSKRGRDWIVEKADLYTYLESRAPAGRPALTRKARRARVETVKEQSNNFFQTGSSGPRPKVRAAKRNPAARKK